MTVSHTSRIQVINTWTHENSSDISVISDKKNTILYQKDFTDGTGTNQAQDMFHSRRSVNSNEEDNLDLNGVLTDVFGNTLTFATIREIAFVNNATSSGEDIVIGGPTGPSAGALLTDLFDGDNESRFKVKSGGMVMFVAPIAGYTVTGGSADIIRVFNIGTGPISYDVIVKGTRT